MAGSKLRRQKGCSLCKPHKFKDNGQSWRQPFSTLRFIGKGRRVTRHDLGDSLSRVTPRVGRTTQAGGRAR